MLQKNKRYAYKGKIYKTYKTHRKYYLRDKAKEQHINDKKLAMEKLGGVKCIYCGCDDIRCLEINHKKLVGSRNRKYSGRTLYWKIRKNEIDISELEILCRVCNSLHFLKEKYGIKNYQILWQDLGNTPRYNESEEKKEALTPSHPKKA